MSLVSNEFAFCVVIVLDVGVLLSRTRSRGNYERPVCNLVAQEFVKQMDKNYSRTLRPNLD